MRRILSLRKVSDTVGLGHVEHVGDVSLLGAFLGEFHDLLAAFLTGHADGVNVTEFAVCAARPAFRGSDTGLAS